MPDKGGAVMQNDLISRSALLKEFEKRQEQQTNKYCDCFLNDAQELSTEWWCVEDVVIAAPTIDAVPVVHGRWVQEDEDAWRCTCCGAFWTFIDGGPEENDARFCPVCGAKMDGGAE